MKPFVDIHCHALFGVDDGAEDQSTMEEMLQIAHRNGTRALCFTPHFNFGEQNCFEQMAVSFAAAESYCKEHLPDLRLFMGNELSYRVGCIDSLLSGECKTLGESRYVLVDFFLVPDAASIIRAVDSLQNAGYLPIVAHVERYDCFAGKMKEIVRLAETGAVIQVNAASILMGSFSVTGRTAKKMLSEGLVHLVASDAHDTVMRSPDLSRCYEKVAGKYGEEYADMLFHDNPEKLLAGKRIVRL